MPAPTIPAVARARAPRRRALPLEQLAFEVGPERPRWSFSRLVLISPHRERIRERLEFVRRFFPELDGTIVRVGLAKKRGILGWGSLDPKRPGVWVRPRRLDYFTVAHEFVHLLQARSLVPRGERSCDLWALARSPLLVDHAPGYLRLPTRMRHGPVEQDTAQNLCTLARAAIAARASGDRRYLAHFEHEVAFRYGEGRDSSRLRAAR